MQYEGIKEGKDVIHIENIPIKNIKKSGLHVVMETEDDTLICTPLLTFLNDAGCRLVVVDNSTDVLEELK